MCLASPRDCLLQWRAAAQCGACGAAAISCDMNAWSGGRCGQMLTARLALVVVPHCAVSSRVALTAWMQVAPGRVSRAVPLSPSTALCLFPTVPTSHPRAIRGPSHRLPCRIPVASVTHPSGFRGSTSWNATVRVRDTCASVKAALCGQWRAANVKRW